MDGRALRLLVSALALTASLALYASPVHAGQTLCEDCVHNCPSDTQKETVCQTLCPGTYQNAVCDDDDECDSEPTRPNLIVCQMGP